MSIVYLAKPWPRCARPDRRMRPLRRLLTGAARPGWPTGRCGNSTTASTPPDLPNHVPAIRRSSTPRLRTPGRHSRFERGRTTAREKPGLRPRRGRPEEQGLADHRPEYDGGLAGDDRRPDPVPDPSHSPTDPHVTSGDQNLRRQRPAQDADACQRDCSGVSRPRQRSAKAAFTTALFAPVT